MLIHKYGNIIFITGLAFDKKEFNDNVLKEHKTLPNRDRLPEIFFSHLSDYQLGVLTAQFFRSFLRKKRVYTYYCDQPYFNVKFIKNVYLTIKDDSLKDKIKKDYEVSKHPFKELSNLLFELTGDKKTIKIRCSNKHLETLVKLVGDPSRIEIESNKNANLIVSDDKDENSIKIPIYKFIAIPTKLFLKLIPKEKSIIVSVGGIEHNLPALYFIAEHRWCERENRFVLLDPMNKFDEVFRKNKEKENNSLAMTLISANPENYVNVKNRLSTKRGDPICYIHAFSWKFNFDDRYYEIPIIRIVGLTAFMTKIGYLRYLYSLESNDNESKKIKNRLMLIDRLPKSYDSIKREHPLELALVFRKFKEYYKNKMGDDSALNYARKESKKDFEEFINICDEIDVINNFYNDEIKKYIVDRLMLMNVFTR